MAVPQRTPVEEFFERSYLRLGRWYIPALLSFTGVTVVTVTMPVETLTQVPLWTGRGFADWRYVGPFMLAAAASSIVLILIVNIRHRALFLAQRGEDVDPVEVWRAGVTKGPWTTILTAGAWGFIAIGYGIARVGPREGFTTETYVAATIPLVMMLIGSGAFYFMLYELAWLPFLRRAAPRLPPDFVDDSGLNMRRRLVLITTAMTFTIGCAAAGVASGFPDREPRMWAVVVGTVALVGTFLGLLIGLLHYGVTRRVNELAASIGTVGRGGSPVRVHPISADEFDDVGRALNRTVDLLEAHARELQESRARLVTVADETRRRAERDLHDGAQQHVAMVSVQLALLARKAKGPEAVEALNAMRLELGEALAELRSLAHGIYPVALEHEGLVAALALAGQQAQMRVVVDAASDLPRWSREVEVALYFCCWELIQSVDRPAAAPVRLALGDQGEWGTFYVSAPVVTNAPAVRLFIRDRIGAVGGEVSISETADGLVAHGTVPLSGVPLS